MFWMQNIIIFIFCAFKVLNGIINEQRNCLNIIILYTWRPHDSMKQNILSFHIYLVGIHV